MESLDSYNFLMMVNSVQEQSIKELFETKKWTCLYKVLPLSCSYLWGLYDDEDRVTGEETAQDQSPRNLPENNTNFGTVASAEVLNFENSEVDRSSSAISVNDNVEKTECNKTQEKLSGVKEYVKQAVNEKLSDQLDIGPSSSDTDDYDANNVAVSEILSCLEKNKDSRKDESEKIEREDTLSEKTETENTTKILNDTKTKNTSRLKKNGILSTDKKYICNTAIPSDLASRKKFKLRQSAVKSRGNTEDAKNLKNRKSISKHAKKEEKRLNKTEQRQKIFIQSSERCASCKQFLYTSSAHSHPFCRSCGKCSDCGKSFPRTSQGWKRYEIHLRNHTGQRPFECGECQATFRSEDNLRQHKEIKHNPEPELVVCDVCSKSFLKRYLKRHMSNMHSGRTASYRCDQCGNTFRYKGSLTQHMMSVHAKQRDFLCDICSSSFTSSHNLRLHRVRHEEDHKLTCTICGKILQAWGFKEHMRRHANERQYQCGKCPKTFYNKRDLVQHYKIHTGERPYECHLCSYSCAIKGNLTKHMKRHRSGDVVPEHKYKGHCDPKKVATNIGKIVYKNFRTDNTEEVHEKAMEERMEMTTNVDQQVEVIHSNDNVTRSEQGVQQSFDTVDKNAVIESVTGNGKSLGLVDMETNVFNCQNVQPVPSLTNANYNLQMHLGLPTEYKEAQHQNQDQPYTQHNVPIYYH